MPLICGCGPLFAWRGFRLGIRVFFSQLGFIILLRNTSPRHPRSDLLLGCRSMTFSGSFLILLLLICLLLFGSSSGCCFLGSSSCFSSSFSGSSSCFFSCSSPTSFVLCFFD